MIKIGIVQMNATNNIEENIKLGIAYCKKCTEKQADIIVFPEMWSTGYYIPKNKEELNQYAITVDSEYLKSFQKVAKEYKVSILITFLEKRNNNYYNSASLITINGEIAYTYRKVHTCDFGEEKVLTSGEDFYVYPLETKNNKVIVGTMICYDREFPESARILMLKGAELVLVPNACPLEINRISQLRGRAYENMIGIVTVNYPSSHEDCNGHSNAFDGIAYDGKSEGSRDTLLFEAPSHEGIYIVNMPIEDIRNYRLVEVHGNSYRRPQKYKPLIDEVVAWPFIRKDKNN